MASVFRSHDGIYFVSWNWLPLKLTVSELILNYEIVVDKCSSAPFAASYADSYLLSEPIEFDIWLLPPYCLLSLQYVMSR
jgi:hypothetical protein